jgi:prepilin-type processing-associated H-X9-DG protein
MTVLIRAGALAAVTALALTMLMVQGGAGRVTAAAAQPPADADLALVPTDAVGFVHVRAKDLWKTDLFAGFRQTFEKAGPKAMAALDAQFVPKISTFERATGFLLLDERQHPLPFLVLRFTAPFSAAEVVKAYMPDAEKTIHAGRTVYHGERLNLDLYFPDDRHIIVSPAGSMTAFLRHESPRTGPLSYGLKLAASGKPVTAALNVSALPIPPGALKDLPAEAMAVLNADHVTLSLDLATAARVDLVAGYKNADQAAAAEKAILALAAYARKELASLKAEIEKKVFEPRTKGHRTLDELPEAVFSVFALGAVNHADDLLANPGAIVKRNGADLTASVTLPKELVVGVSGVAAVGTALLMPAVAKVRMSAARMQAMNNLKQIALAMHNYESTYGHFPHDILDKDGKPILSWRVAILPFIEQDNLYKQFKLDEPWDSDNNKKWSEVAIKVFMSPQADPTTPPGMTHHKVFSGPGAAFEKGKKIKFTDFLDGTSNTILVVEAGEPVPWAKPGDISFDPKKALPKLALPGVEDLVNVAFADGSVRVLKMSDIDEKKLKALITRDGGEVIADNPPAAKK